MVRGRVVPVNDILEQIMSDVSETENSVIELWLTSPLTGHETRNGIAEGILARVESTRVESNRH